MSPVTVVTGNNHHELMGFGIWRSESNVDQLQQIRDLHEMIPEWHAVWRTACGDGSSYFVLHLAELSQSGQLLPYWKHTA